MHDRLGLSRARTAILIILSLLVGGIAGLISVLACRFAIRLGGVDSAEKHGISTSSAIRVGGVLVCMYLVLNIAYQYFILDSRQVSPLVLEVLGSGVVFFCLGFYEDITGSFSTVNRFILMLLISLVIVYFGAQDRKSTV